MRHERLRQAMATGATTLLTACPKCRIHFKCTLSGKCEEAGLDPKLKVKDIVTFVAENME
jgi:Fe-S oxidoreductase